MGSPIDMWLNTVSAKAGSAACYGNALFPHTQHFICNLLLNSDH